MYVITCIIIKKKVKICDFKIQVSICNYYRSACLLYIVCLVICLCGSI